MLTGTTLFITAEWIIRIVMLFYIPQRRSPSAARTWLLLVFFEPLIGLTLYSLFGRIYYPARRIEEQARASQYIRAAQSQMSPHERVPAEALGPISADAAAIAARLGDFDVFPGNGVELLADYQGSVHRLVADIGAARNHVHLLYYIFEGDATGRRVADAMIATARRGVSCRVLMDAVGSKRGLKRLAAELRAASVEVHAALPVGLFRRGAARFDLRNHRKIAVIDGTVGYVGSQNLVDPEFIPDCPNEELVARVTGPVVMQLQAVFLADRYFETGEILDAAAHFPATPHGGTSPAQVLPSGPGYGRENGQSLFVSLLYAARKRVVITTPYFVPDEPFLQALTNASARGVEVRLVVSARSNQRVTHLAQQSYYDQLLEAGVRVHLYEPRFLHAKHLSIDDSVALIGSTNIDIRSFALNCEVSLLVYDAAVVAELRRVQERYVAHSSELARDAWSGRTLGARIAQNSARLADSLL